MNPYESLRLWTNDPLIGAPAQEILSIAERHKTPATPTRVRPEEFDIPFPYRYDPEDEQRVQLFRRIGVLFAALDIHCYWNDGRQVIGVALSPEDPISKAWCAFNEDAMEVLLAFVLSKDLS